MKTNWYCVNAEFYDYGKVSACMTEKQAEKKPNDQHRRVYGMTAFKIWISQKATAKTLIRLILDGAAHIDDLANIMSAHAMDKHFGRAA